VSFIKLLNISGSSSQAFSCLAFIIFIQFFITDKFLNHKKSIFNNHMFSSVGQSYWLTNSCTSSFAYCIGVYVSVSSGAIITPHACTHNCLRFHSNFDQNFTAFCIFSSELYRAFRSSFHSGLFIASITLVLSGIRFEN
jgi:hypothetical protein